MKSRRLIALAGAIVLVAAMAACSDKKETTSGDGKVDGAGKTLDVFMGANTIYPEQQRAWFADVSAKFQAETGATVKFETFASANDELTKIQTSVLSGQGPDIYALGTTFTPTAYATGAFVEMGSKEWKAVGGKDQFDPASFGISGPSTSKQIGIPFASRPFVMAVSSSWADEYVSHWTFAPVVRLNSAATSCCHCLRSLG